MLMHCVGVQSTSSGTGRKLRVCIWDEVCQNHLGALQNPVTHEAEGVMIGA